MAQTAMQPAQKTDDLPWHGKELKLITDVIAPGLTEQELLLFAKICAHTRLNPFLKQVYGIKRGNKLTIQTSIDGYRVIAARTGQLAGIDDAVYGEEKEGHPLSATVTVYRMVQGQRCPFTATARWAEYKPPEGQDHMWKRMPFLMLAKCAESLALRKAFPAELSGLYTDAEMEQAGTSEAQEATFQEEDPIIEECRQLAKALKYDKAAWDGMLASYRGPKGYLWANIKSALETAKAEKSLPEAG